MDSSLLLFVSWVLVTGRMTATAAFLALADLGLERNARSRERHVHVWYVNATGRTGVTDDDTALRWNA